MVKAKSSVILTLESGTMAQTSATIDDDETWAKDLWEAIAALYSTSNEKTVLRFMHELAELELKEQDCLEAF